MEVLLLEAIVGRGSHSGGGRVCVECKLEDGEYRYHFAILLPKKLRLWCSSAYFLQFVWSFGRFACLGLRNVALVGDDARVKHTRRQHFFASLVSHHLHLAVPQQLIEITTTMNSIRQIQELNKRELENGV